MSESVRFETDVEGLWGYLPGSPPMWSFSSLKDVEACPRRWVLSRAHYPDVWGRHGYPRIPHLASLLGDVIHRALEVTVEALAASGCIATNSSEAVGVLRGLGGLSAVLREAIDLKVDGLGSNPRVSPIARENLRQALLDQLGVASNRVQLFLSRGTLPAWVDGVDGPSDASESSRGGGGQRRRRSVGVGAHPEVDVVADQLRLWGRIDLVTVDESGVTITDFKTGHEDPSHDEQVRLYALLWARDRQTNPERRATTALVVSYPARDRAVPVPDASALRTLEASLTTRIANADLATSTGDPRALPSPDTCAFCHVRHLCGDYWEKVAPSPAEVPAREWFDIEGKVLRQNGVKSWVVKSEQGGHEVLVRTPNPSKSLPVGKRIRVLGVRKVEDPDRNELVIVALGNGSETYIVTEATR